MLYYYKKFSFYQHNANIYGGAIHNDGFGTGLCIDNSTFIKNNANNEGGAIYNWKGKDFSVNNSKFINNTAQYMVQSAITMVLVLV